MVKSYEVVVTARAENDHRNILAYLAKNASYQTSEEIDSIIINSIKKLHERPEINGLYKANILPTKGYRRVIIKRAWNLIFQIDEVKKIVFVLRILHVKRGDNFIKTAFK